MRIFLLLTAAAGVAAIATAAPAQPAGKFTGSPRAWAATGNHHRAGAGWQGRSRPGMGRDRRHGRPDRDDPYFYDGGGIAGPTGIVAPYGNGFFAAGGGEVHMRGSRPHYDYDRSYPYEWAGGALEWRVKEIVEPSTARCTVEKGVRVCRGGR